MSEPKQEYVFETVLVAAPDDSGVLTQAEQRQALVDEIGALAGQVEATQNQLECTQEELRRKEIELGNARTQIERLTEQLAGARAAWAGWEERAQKEQDRAIAAERQVNAVTDCLKEKMIFKPTDNWQWGYRAGLMAVLDVIVPPEEEKKP